MATNQATKYQKETNTGGLVKLLTLKIGTKVMLAVKIDLAAGLIKSQTVSIKHIEFAQGSVCKVHVKFLMSKLISMKSSYLRRHNYWVPIEKCETKIPTKALIIF